MIKGNVFINGKLVKNAKIYSHNIEQKNDDITISISMDIPITEDPTEKDVKKIIYRTKSEAPNMLYDDTNDWEIGTHIKDFIKKTNGMDEYSKEYEEIQKEYAQLLRIQTLNFGLVMFIDDFADTVDSGGFNSYDGSGVFLDEFGVESKDTRIRFDAEWIRKQKNKFKYVCWYNK